MVMRDRFDVFLVEKAREASAELYEDEPATGVREEGDGVEVATARGRYRDLVSHSTPPVPVRSLPGGRGGGDGNRRGRPEPCVRAPSVRVPLRRASA